MGNLRLLPDEPSSDDEEWKKLLSSIDTLSVPFELLKKVIIYHEDGTNHTIDFQANNNKSYLINYLEMHDDEIVAIDYIVNFEKLKATVRKNTNKALKNL